MSSPLLLLMDYQEGICRQEGPIGRHGTAAEVTARGILERACSVLSEFRSLTLPVVHARVAFDENYHRMTSGSHRFAQLRKNKLLLEDDAWTDICSEVAPLPEEPVVNKGCVNPFIGTHLAQTLIRLAPNELVLGGVATEHVVESTARFAADSGYRVVVLEDLCASSDAEIHRCSIEYNLPLYAAIRQSHDYLSELKIAQEKDSS